MRKADPDLHSRRSAEIAHAASGVFLERGFHGTSMQEIARAAGVSMGLLYRYFDNKEAIVAAAARLDRREVLDAITALETSDDLAGDVSRLGRSLIDAALSDRYVSLVAEITAEGLRNPRIAEVLKEDQRELSRALASALDVHRRKGLLGGNTDTGALAVTILTLVDGLAVRLSIDPTETADGPLEILRAVIAGEMRSSKLPG